MSLIHTLLGDPPPAWAFEVSEAGIAFGKTATPGEVSFRPLPAGAISVSPLRDNVQQPDVLAREVAALAPPMANRRHRAALILPDYCARTAVLDFDAFPASADEQRALVRFRMKKTVPFDLESAIISHYQQPAAAGEKIDVVVALIPQEIVARYEAPFRAAGFQTGEVTTSALAALHMVEPRGIALLAKLGGQTLSVMVLRGSVLKLARCVELAEATSEEVLAVLHPTVAYIEDELHARPERLVLCGFGRMADEDGPLWRSDLGVEVEQVRSRFGAPSWSNAGLLGYMESLAA
jgi:type IV pilus assembly protein PilM